MKAIIQDRYGSPDVLRFADVATPAIGEHDLLVRVKASAVNARDWHFLRGDPYLARLASPVLGRKRPKTAIRGSDLAGVVEAVGAGVTGFRPGDEVFGDLREGDGAFAEYAAVPSRQACLKPAKLSFAEAAVIPLAGATALRGIRNVGQVKTGQRVLINGASGGVGTFAVQIAKHFGAHVTAVCRTRNIELVTGLGADHVIDYTRDDFTTAGPFDVVFDLVGNRSLTELQRPLVAGGIVILSGGGVSGNGKVSAVGPMGLYIKGATLGRLSRNTIRALNDVPPGEDLAVLKDLVESGAVKPVIDRTYTLSEVPDAIRYVEAEHARAKVAITVG
ncbi:NAD(P)-dependent alcohol dehydrogenase [Catelliglobosispora koreensis]|uniref:NAD(P)-dependent alcohol dehydrogenase n=1 Tax=Catelliglobosispora koreensis TaxID=129052 RepID=UPI0003A63840|nr:NAD(P)-dependent alcohol dehydrogenase [Catelliglobosispora koreensis]